LSEPIDNNDYLFWKAGLKYKTIDGDTNKQKVNSKIETNFKEKGVRYEKVICYFVIMCFSMACPGMAVLPATFAEALSSEEQTVVYSKEVLQETLNKIKTNLTEGLSNTTELVFLESIRDDPTEQLLKIESTAEEVRGTLPASYIGNFEVNLEEKLSGLRNLIKKIDNIIINDPVSIGQIDTVLDLIEVLDPEVQGEVLATKPELPNRTVDTKANVFKARPVKATGAPVTEADLAETAEIIITPAIEALALELNNDVVDIFTWVKFNIDYEPYYGSMKGSNETLTDMAGNDCDTSSLLLALLRASGIPSRYVRGDVELKIEDLMNWTGGKTPEAAIAIMQRNKIPTEVIYKFDKPEGVIFDHIWVEAFDGHNWRLMDPSFKIYVYTEGVDFEANEDTANDIAAAITHVDNKISIDYVAISGIFETQTTACENELGHLTVDEVLGKRGILISEKNNLPPYLAKGIIGDRKPAEEFSVMPENMKVKVKITLTGGASYETPLSLIAGKRVSIVYVPATAGDQAIIDWYGSIYDVPLPSLTVQMRPELQIDGETVASGASIGLGLYGRYAKIGFLRPGTYDPLLPITDADWEFTNKPLLAGNRYNVSITTQRTSLDEASRLGEKAQEVIIGLLGDTPMTDDMIDESLRLSGMLYFGSVSSASDHISKSLNVVSVSHISMGYICDEIRPSLGFFGIVWSISKGSVHIDVVRSVSCPTSTIGNQVKLHG